MTSNLNWIVGHGSDPMAMPTAEDNQSWMKTNIPMQIHGVCMILAWLYFGNLGGFVARYMKFKLWWFKVHLAFQILCCLLSVIGFVIIVIHISLGSGGHFNSLHKFTGLVVMVLAFGQVVLGMVAHYTWFSGKQTSAIDKWHWHVGRVVLLISFFNVVIGIETFSAEAEALGLGVWVFLATFFLALFGFLAVFNIHLPILSHEQYLNVNVNDDLSYHRLEEENERFEKQRKIQKVFFLLCLSMAAIVIVLTTGLWFDFADDNNMDQPHH